MTAQRTAENKLVMLSPLRVHGVEEDPLRLPRKFVDGIAEFAARWRGRLELLIPPATQPDDNLDHIPVMRRTLNFGVRTFPPEPDTLRHLLERARVVLVPLVPWYTHVPDLCRAVGVPCVIDADFTLNTRREIARAGTRNPLRRWRRLIYVQRLEPHFRAMFRAAAGAHLLGMAAYTAYAPLTTSPLLYYDTRVRRDMLATGQQLAARAARLEAGAPLRLVYSGRWIPIKGVQDLPRVAAALDRLGVPYEMDVFGGGVLESQLRQTLAAARLSHVHLRGTLPFVELMRRVATESDLFVCCHRQGDPSTTFVEMLSVGIPLLGYDQEGLRNILAQVPAGWLTPRDDPPALAAQLREVALERRALAAASKAGAAFTAKLGFEDMVQQRAAHLEQVAAQFPFAGDKA